MSALMIIIVATILVFVLVAFKKETVLIFNDGIKIKDLMYPLWIPNDTIVSINIIDNLPKLIYRTNGTGMGPIQKGYFTIKKNDFDHSENVTLYIRNRNVKAIEIRTVKGLVYINQKNEELTEDLFNEMKNNVKILKDNELNYYAKPPRSRRSIVAIGVLLAAILIPVMFVNYSNEVVVTDDAIEIKGEYAMTIPFSDIDTVLLIEKLPPIKTRTNGISTRKVNIGKFKMSNGQKANLYINKDVPLFIEIRPIANSQMLKAQLVFINRKTVEDTKALYEEINLVRS